MQPSRTFISRRRGRSPPPGGDSHSQIDEASSASSSQAADSQAADSMRPLAPPARKRRRTILDAFQSIHLQNEDEEDADSSQAVADIEGEDVSDSTIEDEDESQEDRLLSDREEAERKVMLELVLGPKPKRNPVDEKVAAMVRETIKKATDPHAVPVAPASATRDDMHIEAPYSRSSVAALPPPAALERSNSLPDMPIFEDNDAMDISMR
mmetsp:Transcript_13989/g.26812  ORF Transcript_13989/g.26812 Transcript_13989/m.26812 type:complete len:210 (+) Transcript_13989:247-876(+)